MNFPQATVKRTSAVAGTLLPLVALIAWGWSLAPKPTATTLRKSGSPAHPIPHYWPVAASSASSAGQNPNTEISSFLSNLCLQPVNESKAQGAPIVQEPCGSSPAQQWTVVPVNGDVVHYVNQLSGLCLDARGGAANRTPVQQWTCNKISNENWEPGPYVSDTVPVLYSRVSGTKGFCLDVPGGQTTPGLAMQIYRCNGTLAQLWWTP